MKDKLKPCPFCGGEKVIILEEGGNSEIFENIRNYIICCDFNNGGCGATSGFRLSEEEAIEAWNRRADKRNDE